ncbi:hypothetical protein BHM03_00062892 [Ensete ventricosum]|nr:hypothetical protein BHM03_00062892 [Ensete ventricosum]
MQPLPVAAQPCPTLPCCHCFPTTRPKAATSRSTCYHHRPCSSLAAPVVLDPTSVRSSERIVATTAAHHALPLLPSPPSSSTSIFQPLAQLPMLLPRPSQSAFLPYRSRLQPRPLSLPSSQSPLPLILCGSRTLITANHLPKEKKTKCITTASLSLCFQSLL